MYSKVELITPAVAHYYLGLNIEGNRRVSTSKVKAYAEDMAKGKWQLTSQGITFNQSGKLTDGQHRLLAIIKAGVPVKMYVTRGEPDSSFIHDRGSARRAADVFYMSGRCVSLNPYEQKQALAIANFVFTMTDNTRRSDSSCFDFIVDNEELISNAVKLAGGNGSISRQCAVQTAFASALVSGVRLSDLERFCKVLDTGFMDSKEDSSAIVARKFAQNGWLKEFRAHGDSSRRRICFLTCSAIKDFVSRVERTRNYPAKDISKIPYIRNLIALASEPKEGEHNEQS